MPRTNLTDARIIALKPRKTAYDIRDAKLKGFGVRVQPSGRKRFFVHCQHRGERVWKILGDAGAVSVKEARSRAAGTLASIRRGEPVPLLSDETLFESVAETVFERYRRLWKPGTLERTGTTSRTSSCRISGNARSPTSTRGTSGNGSPPCTPRPSPPTARCRCSPSS